MQLNDNLLDLSGVVGAIFVPAVPANLKMWHLFGGTLQKSTTNFANPAEPATVSGTPTILSPAGVQYGAGSIVLGEGFAGGGGATSETVMIAFQVALPGPLPYNSSYDAVPLANTFDSTKGSKVFEVTQNGVSCTYADPTNRTWGVRIPATQATIVTPQCYVAIFDTGAQVQTLANLSQPQSQNFVQTQALSGNALNRISNTNPYTVLEIPDTNCTTTVYAVAKWDRALSATELQAAYKQMQQGLRTRGVTI